MGLRERFSAAAEELGVAGLPVGRDPLVVFHGRRAYGPGEATFSLGTRAAGRAVVFQVQGSLRAPGLRGEGRVRSGGTWNLRAGLGDAPGWLRGLAYPLLGLTAPLWGAGVGLRWLLSSPEPPRVPALPAFAARFHCEGEPEPWREAFPEAAQRWLLEAGYVGGLAATPGRLLALPYNGSTERGVLRSLALVHRCFSWLEERGALA